MSKIIFQEDDGDISIIKNKQLAIIGYGNQGRAQALNLRDSGLEVIIGNRQDDYRKKAEKDGFQTYPISEAIKQAEIIFLLIPDELMKEIYNNEIKPYLKANSALVFAHGYSIAFDLIKPSDDIDILLLAPRMIGTGVREKYLTGEGFYSFIAVHNNASGQAKKILLGLCKGIGTLKKGAIELSFKQETVLDLFNEQAFGPAFGRVLLNSIFTLVDAGYPPEAVLIEMYMSGEMEYTYQKFRKMGLVKQVNLHSHTSQYGAMSRGIKFVNLPLKKTMKNILFDIESGKFSKEWEKTNSKLKLKFLKFFSTKTRINRLEKKVRKNLDLQEITLDEDILIKKEEKKLTKKMEEELAEFEKYFDEY
ncbi:MAG: ketol-acid reductoisomerase [Asgard group archaeon]|nr:ketol-acid reductoisomerase [Asgard group archaeon]